MPEIEMLPNQTRLYEELREGKHRVVGVGGGRGSLKSSAADRAIITLMAEVPNLSVCLIMRTWQAQLVPFHLEAIRASMPWLVPHLKTSPPAILRLGTSRCEYKYAQNYEAVEEAFRSGNYHLVVVDQAEQFSLRELVEISKACRSTNPNYPLAKLCLLFNMRGSGIQDLKKIFLEKTVWPGDTIFFKFDPWDNVAWVQEALTKDGYTVTDYYGWTDEQRKMYAAVNGPYTRQLATDDPVISAADWEGSWDSIEGSYFANVFDLESTRLSPALAEQLDKNWATHWISTDWGRTHYCATYWHYRVALSPSESSQLLGYGGRSKPLNVAVTYREMIVNEKTSTEVGNLIVEHTAPAERSRIRAFFLSPEDVTGDPNSIGSQIGKELRNAGMPYATKADNDRKGGWALMSKLLQASKYRGHHPEAGEVDDVWLISSECPQLLASIPILMRDPKNLDDVLKTDLGNARIEQDVADAARYGIKSMLAPRKMTESEKINQAMSEATPAERMQIAYREAQKQKQKSRLQFLPSKTWR